MARIQMVMTRGKDDEKALYDLLGNKDERKKFDTQFKKAESNFKIAIVVDMWLTGFDVPFLDTIYIDKPVQRHNLIQTISRVNRKFENKKKGLVVDYIGIKKQMNSGAGALLEGGQQQHRRDRGLHHRGEGPPRPAGADFPPVRYHALLQRIPGRATALPEPGGGVRAAHRQDREAGHVPREAPQSRLRHL